MAAMTYDVVFPILQESSLLLIQQEREMLTRVRSK